MKTILAILAVIGSVCALQYPVEYRYRYEGRLGVGIPEIRSQVAGLGIKALVVIQMKSKTSAMGLIDEIQVGEYNDDLECVQLRQPIPFKWEAPPQPYEKEMKQPFGINFPDDSGNCMSVSNSEPEYISNIRKSIIGSLRVSPILANMGGEKADTIAKFMSGGDAPDAFTVEEDNIFGRCENEYVLTRVPEKYLPALKAQLAETLKQDDQAKNAPRSGGNSSVPKLEEQYWRLSRSVAFDKCFDRVQLQHTGGANMSHAGHAQFRAVQARSSVGAYILKGVPGAFRMERVFVEGDVIAHPYGYRTHRLQTITNQTITLESARAISDGLKMPRSSRILKTWRYEVNSQYGAPEGHPKIWVNYRNQNDRYFPVESQAVLLGLVNQTRENEPKYVENFKAMLDAVVEEVWAHPSLPSANPSWDNTEHSKAVTYLYWMSRIMRALKRETCDKLFTEYFQGRDIVSQRKQTVLVDVAAASGASAPLKVLLEKMKKNELSPERIGSILMTIPNNLMSPTIIPELMEYVKSVDIGRYPILASTALTNFASLAERVCLNDKKLNYTIPNPVFGNEICQPSLITDDYLPYLDKKLKESSKSWERAIYLQAIANLGTPKILPIMKTYIYGHVDPNPRVRMVAIYGLTKKRLPDSAREKVFDNLMEVLHSLEEDVEIRQTAFYALLSWQPDAAWWQSMARLTWREPSEIMAAFISFTIESMSKATEPHLSEQARIALFVLPLRKPFSPSTKYSYHYLYSRYNEPQKVGINSDFTSLLTDREAFPIELYNALKENFGDLHIPLYEISLASEGLGDIFKQAVQLLQKLSGGETFKPINARGSHARHVEQILSDMQVHVGPIKHSDESTKEAYIYMRLFENLYQYLPLSSEVIGKIAGEGGSDFIKKLINGKNMNMTKFFNPIDIEYTWPTEIGLPVMGSVAIPTMTKADAEVRLDVPDNFQPTLEQILKAPRVSLIAKADYKFMSKLIVKMEVLSPWNKKLVAAGVENMIEVNLPCYANLTLEHSEERINFTMNFAPTTDDKFPVFHKHSVPFTETRSVLTSVTARRDYKVIGVQKDRNPSLKVEKKLDKKHTGIAADFSYHSDAPYPFTAAYLGDYLLNPETAGKLLVSPTIKQYQYALVWDPRASTSRNVSVSLCYLTPKKSDSQGSDSIPDFSADDDQDERLRKISSLSRGNQVYAFNAQLHLNGSEYRKYEAVVACTRTNERSSNTPRGQYRTVVGFLSSRIPGVAEESRALCSQCNIEKPDITDYESLKRAIQQGPSENIDGRVFRGKSCQSPQIASYKALWNVSPERASLLQNEVEKICNYDHRNPVVELQTAAIYDTASIDIDFDKEKIPENLRNYTLRARECVEGYLFPHGSHDNLHRGSQNKIRVQAQRPISSERYTFWADMPDKRSIYSEIKVPYWATRIVPLNGLKTSSASSNLLIYKEGANACVFESLKVITFDGVQYPIESIGCYATAVMNNNDPASLLVHTRKPTNGPFEAQVLIPYAGNMHVEATPTKATINGKPMNKNENSHTVKDKEGKVVFVVKRHNGYFEIDLPKKLNVLVQQLNIEITPDPSMKGAFRGICGDYDGSQLYDKTGPKNCLYTDDKLFQYAWTIPDGDGCDLKTYQEMLKQVHDFQARCPKRPGRLTAADMRNIYQTKLDNCYQHVYPIRKSGRGICVSREAVQICSRDCKMHDRKSIQESAKCWPSHSAPSDVREGESRGYITHPAVEDGKWSSEIRIDTDTDCRTD